MTKIAIVPNAAGTGTFTIEAPNSNSNRTLVLPDAAGELFTNAGGTLTGALTGTDITLSGGVYLGGTGSANLLDDYEEGTWTPSFSASGVSGVTYVRRNATYVKVGNLVTVNVGVDLSNKGSGGSGTVNITGLPFTSLATQIFANSAVMLDNLNTAKPGATVQLNTNTTTVSLIDGNGTGTHATITWDNFNNTSVIRFLFSYIV